MSLIELETRGASLLGTRLERAFGVAFATWEFQDGWCALAPQGRAAEDFLAALLLETPEHVTQPFVLGHFPEGAYLAVPCLHEASPAKLAVGLCAEGPERLLVELARSCQREMHHDFALAQQQDENNSLSSQLSDDMEELSFLRSLTQSVTPSQLSGSWQQVAAALLPVLNLSAKAECLACVMAANQGGEARASRVVALAGPRPLRNADCALLVEQFRRQLGDRPYVHNHFVKHKLSTEFRGVREFCIARIGEEQAEYGWLLAVNRDLPPEERIPREIPRSRDEFGTVEATLLASTATILAGHALNQQLFHDRESLLTSVVRSLVCAMEAKDTCTWGHSERVAAFARRLAQQLGWSEVACEHIYLTGLLHDVGKIGVPDAVLNNPGDLSDQEWEAIRKHPEQGWSMLRELQPLSFVFPGVLYHHERYDGRGYPLGLDGERIPAEGRLLAIVDAYDAMTSDRPYRKSFTHEEAVAQIKNGAGQQWDPLMVPVFLNIAPHINDLRLSLRAAIEPTEIPVGEPV